MSNVNWEISPQDATHAGTMGGVDYQCWYRFDGNQYHYWYSNDGILETEGWKVIFGIPSHQPLIPRPDITWVPGQSLPPVGMKVALVNDNLAEHSILYKVDSFAGDEVEIIAHFTSSNGVEIALYKFETMGGSFVKQAVKESFTSLENAESIKAKKKEDKDLKSLREEFGVSLGDPKNTLLESLYRSGRLTA